MAALVSAALVFIKEFQKIDHDLVEEAFMPYMKMKADGEKKSASTQSY